MSARRFACAAAAAIALTGCGSPSDSVTFHAPPGFHQRASFGPFMQMWESQPDNALMLIAIPGNIDMNQAMQQSNMKDARVEKSRRLTICNGQEAFYADIEGQMNTTGASKAQQHSQVEFLMTHVKGKTYMAMYVRPLHEKPDPAAESAIRNLCPK